MNKSIFMGRLVRDPEIRYTDTEKGELAIANFRIAVDRKFVRKDGVKTDYFTCSAFGRLAEFAEKYLLQGIKVVVSGRMENDNYKNEDGEQVYGMRLMAEDIEFAESKKAMEDRMEEKENDRRERSSGKDSERGSSGRSSRSGSSVRERDSERGRSSGGSRRPARDEDYEEERGQDRDSGRRSSGRSAGNKSSGGRTNGSRSSGSSRPAGRSRSVDEEYMEAPDDDLDFD